MEMAGSFTTSFLGTESELNYTYYTDAHTMQFVLRICSEL